MSEKILEAPPEPKREHTEVSDIAGQIGNVQDFEFRTLMYRWLTRLIDTVIGGFKVSVSVVPGTVNAQQTKEVDVTVNGAKVGDAVVANKPTQTAGIVVGGARVKSADTVSILLGNVTGGNIAVPTEDYLVTVIRR